MRRWNATSFQILEEGFNYWFDGEDACVAYADTGRAWVVAGAPIAPDDRMEVVANRFQAAAEAARRRVAYFAVEKRFLAVHRGPAIHVGEQPVWTASQWTKGLNASRSMKEQVRRARAKAVCVRVVPPLEIGDAHHPTRQALELLIQRWLASRPMAPMGFLVDVQPFSFPDERRYFVAEHEGRIVAFLAAVPVYRRRGWLLEDLLRDPSAPNGTTELLVDC